MNFLKSLEDKLTTGGKLGKDELAAFGKSFKDDDFCQTLAGNYNLITNHDVLEEKIRNLIQQFKHIDEWVDCAVYLSDTLLKQNHAWESDKSRDKLAASCVYITSRYFGQKFSIKSIANKVGFKTTEPLVFYFEYCLRSILGNEFYRFWKNVVYFDKAEKDVLDALEIKYTELPNRLLTTDTSFIERVNIKKIAENKNHTSPFDCPFDTKGGFNKFFKSSIYQELMDNLERKKYIKYYRHGVELFQI